MKGNQTWLISSPVPDWEGDRGDYTADVLGLGAPTSWPTAWDPRIAMAADCWVGSQWMDPRWELKEISPMAHSEKKWRASLVVQWLRIRLSMQGTRVQALVREDPTCRGANKPVRHNYWACALEPTSHNYWARAPQLLKPAHLEPVLRKKRSHRDEKPMHHNKE